MLLMESLLYSTKNLKGIQNIDKYAFKNKRQTVFPHQTFKSKKSYFQICYLILCSSLPTVYNICVSYAVYSTEYLLLMYGYFIENFLIEFLFKFIWLYIFIYCNLYSLELEMKYDISRSILLHITSYKY